MISTFKRPYQPINIDKYLNYGSSYLILQEAKKRGIDCQVILRTKKNQTRFLYLCLKKEKQYRWLSPARGYFNSKVSCELALYKDLTYQILQPINLPVPRFIKIRRLKHLEKINFNPPWVVKPIDQTHGKDVLINIKEREELRDFCRRALKKHRYLIVEELIQGNDFRLLILENKLLGAVKRIPPYLQGDGRHTIKQLIKISNQKERKNKAGRPAPFLKKIKIDFEVKKCLEEQGFSLNSIPFLGKKIKIRRNANFTTGGTVKDVTGQVHPQNIKIAIQALKALGLKFGGVDIVTQKISQPLTKNKGKIIEINSAPGLWIHHFPHQGQHRNPSREILDYLLKD